MTKYKYIEIKERRGNENVIKRLDVSSSGDRIISQIMGGMSINMNHNDYMIFLNETEDKLEEI